MKISDYSIDVNKIKTLGKELFSYIDSLQEEDRKIWQENFQLYQPDKTMVEKLDSLMKNFNGTIIVYSAAWCKDCRRHVPALAKTLSLLNKKPEVYVRSGFKTDPLNKARKWRIPPSPPEIEELNVTNIPTFILYDSAGNEIGRIIEHPRQSIEADLVDILEKYEKKKS